MGSPLILMLYDTVDTHCITQLTHLPQKPILIRHSRRKSHSIRSLAFCISNFSTAWNLFFLSCVLILCNTSCTIKILSWIWRPPTKALCYSSIRLGSNGFSLFVNVLEMILYMKLHRLIGQNCSIFLGFGSLGMRVIDVLLSSRFKDPVSKNCCTSLKIS